MESPNGLLYTEPMATEISKLASQLWRYALKEKKKVIAVTSALRGEGKSTTVAHLAAALASYPALKILVVDFDTRNPTVQKFFNVQVEGGLAEVLRGERPVTQAIVRGNPGPDLLVPISSEDDPQFLLRAPRLGEIFQVLRKSYDLILVDTPALVPVADATAVLPLCDAVIMVVMAGSSTKHHLKRARELCLGLGVTILGLVVGNVQQAAPEYLDTHYYGYSTSRSKGSRSQRSGKP